MTGAARRPVTDRRQMACSGPPKRRDAAYPHRPGAGPGRTPRRARHDAADRKRIRVILPDEPPVLTPGAARVLLRILLKAHVRAIADDQRKEGRP
jgi:hypothetical protein